MIPAVKYKYNDREKSWLSFNARVLQEAADTTVPLLDRLRFLGIFSNNLDEFFRVRFAAIRRLSLSKDTGEKILGISAKQLLKEITQITIKLQAESLKILQEIESQLEKENIFIITENEITIEQKLYLDDLFTYQISPELVTIILNNLEESLLLKDTSGYLAVNMTLKKEIEEKKSFFTIRKPKKEERYAVIEIPNNLNRFVVLPKIENKNYIILLDDVIRLYLDRIFNIFEYENIEAHMIKITRDAQLDIESDLNKSFVEQISSSVKDRRIGEVVRFVYDTKINKNFLNFLLNKLHIKDNDSVIPGGRYHNRRDYMGFPNLGRKDLLYPKKEPLIVKDLEANGSILNKISKKDYLIHTPYQSFSYVIKFLREAALDPKVQSIKITLYRLAKNSQIISSLINAAKNGKKVTVQIELQARFDEESNINYAEILQTEGISLIFGVKGLKVHSKVCVLERLEQDKIKKYGFISTGNFNEASAKIYTDVTLFTAHQGILKDGFKIFDFFEINYKINRYKDLIVSPQYTRSRFYKLIDREIMHALNGKNASIKLKMNSLSDQKVIDKLYDASRAGVKVSLIVRGICSLIPKVKGMSENIEAISIVDNFLEHTRVYIFENNGNPDVFISSADFMTRNLDGRVEVTCPIYDIDIKNELINVFDISWKGNVKARLHSEKMDNIYKKRTADEPVFRAQQETYEYYQKLC